jgi:2-oxoglutarate dehydrogenase E2 component (dihydrolipoamide succinyltransferase)
MGESIAEGTIVRWIKKTGEAVDRDEPLFEISTDKVDAEIPSPVGGVLAAIYAQVGETVPVDSVVAVIGTDGETVSAPVASATSASSVVPVIRARLASRSAEVTLPLSTPLSRLVLIVASPLLTASEVMS